MTVTVHPTAVVDPGASLGDRVVIGPFCYVGPDVVVGDGTELLAQVTVLGPATLGRNNRVHPGAVLGAAPQDRTHGGEPTTLTVGDGNEVREHVTIHRGTTKGLGRTEIGSGGLFMVGVHVAHDCVVGDGVTLTNRVSLGGHVEVEDRVVCGGHVAVAPFCRLGTLCFIAGGAMVERSVPPFLVAQGDRARVRGLNRIGLRRAEVPEASIDALRNAYRLLYRSGEPRSSVATSLTRSASDPYVLRLARFVIDSAS